METAGVDPDVSFDLSVALSEACANAVEHGGAGPGGSAGAYRVTAYLDGEKCRIEVADSGPGFPGGPPRRARGCTHSGTPSGVQESTGAAGSAGATGAPGPAAVPDGPGALDASAAPVAPAGPGGPRTSPGGAAAGPAGGSPGRSPGRPLAPGAPGARPPGRAAERTVDRAAATAESGRGLFLIQELADHVHFSNRPGRGAVVSFDKILKWREGALLKVS
ncbi:ATP-binding protein [Streptomyces sp. NPDC003691]